MTQHYYLHTTDEAWAQLKTTMIKYYYKDGLHPSQTANKLREVFPEYSKTRANMISRTMGSQFTNMSTVDVYKENGVEEMEWVTDVEACHICTPLNSKVVKIGEAFPGGFFTPPDPHPNCECALYPVISSKANIPAWKGEETSSSETQNLDFNLFDNLKTNTEIKGIQLSREVQTGMQKCIDYTESRPGTLAEANMTFVESAEGKGMTPFKFTPSTEPGMIEFTPPKTIFADVHSHPEMGLGNSFPHMMSGWQTVVKNGEEFHENTVIDYVSGLLFPPDG